MAKNRVAEFHSPCDLGRDILNMAWKPSFSLAFCFFLRQPQLSSRSLYIYKAEMFFHHCTLPLLYWAYWPFYYYCALIQCFVAVVVAADGLDAFFPTCSYSFSAYDFLLSCSRSLQVSQSYPISLFCIIYKNVCRAHLCFHSLFLITCFLHVGTSVRPWTLLWPILHSIGYQFDCRPSRSGGRFSWTHSAVAAGKKTWAIELRNKIVSFLLSTAVGTIPVRCFVDFFISLWLRVSATNFVRVRITYYSNHFCSFLTAQ